MIRPSILIASSTATLLLAACGNNSDSAREQQMEDMAAQYGIDADVELGADGEVASVEINGPGGGRVGNNLALSGDFPDDVFVSPDWNIMSSNAMPTGAQMVQAMSDAAPEALVESIRGSMTAGGWSETAAENPVPTMSQIGFEKGARIASYSIISAGEQRTVQITTMDLPD